MIQKIINHYPRYELNSLLHFVYFGFYVDYDGYHERNYLYCDRLVE